MQERQLPVERKRERAERGDGRGEREDKISQSSNFPSASSEQWYWMAWADCHEKLGLDRCITKSSKYKSSANLPGYWLAWAASASKWFVTYRYSRWHRTLTFPSLMFVFACLDFHMLYSALLPYGAMKCNSFYVKLYAKHSSTSWRLAWQSSHCE